MLEDRGCHALAMLSGDHEATKRAMPRLIAFKLGAGLLLGAAVRLSRLLG